MRVLHLIDPLSPWAGPCTLRALADFTHRYGNGVDRSENDDVLIIGRTAEMRLADECGVEAIGSIWPRGGRTVAAAPALRRWLIAARDAGAAPDLIHAWSSGCGALAALAAPHVPRVVTPRAAAVEIESPRLPSREAVRQRWREDHGVLDTEFVLGLLGEPVHRFDARQAMHVGARAGLSSRRIRLVMSGRSLGRAESERFLARLDLDRVVVQDEGVERPWEVLRGLDAALLLAPAASGGSPHDDNDLSVLPLPWAWAAQVPVVAEASAPICGLIEDGHNGQLFPAGDLNAACDRVARLYDDRALSQRLAATGRALVEQRFSMEIFADKVVRAYRAAAGELRVAYVRGPG
jgi:glycosyltransferase involved in cell wall biosynthesis